MSDPILILSLETTTDVCSVALHQDGHLVALHELHIPRSHSKSLSVMIKDLLGLANIAPKELSAIAISEGPGSYTGLRVGSSTAKGFCFGLDIPLIAISTLSGISHQVRKYLPTDALLCPMIDARRMEVYCQVEDISGEILQDLRPVVLDESSFTKFSDRPFFFCGDGAAKCIELLHWASLLPGVTCSATAIGELAHNRYLKNEFDKPAEFEPNYLKEFRTTVSKKSLL